MSLVDDEVITDSNGCEFSSLLFHLIEASLIGSKVMWTSNLTIDHQWSCKAMQNPNQYWECELGPR
jgi:hypothetical protein